MSGAWLREEQADLAASKILEAAGVAFASRGVAGTGMSDIARAAGCSRGTLYRYFKTRRELQLAFVNYKALELSDRVALRLAGVTDPRERLVASILLTLREVRTTPEAAIWFEPGSSGIAAGMSSTSEVIDALAGAFVATLPAEAVGDAAAPLRARWLVRVIVSLLTAPGRDAAEERALVERFVAPGLLEAG